MPPSPVLSIDPSRELLAGAFTAARAGRVRVALADLDRVRAGSTDALSELDRAALLTTSIDCRLARGELAEALSLGEQLGRHLDAAGLVGATAHYGRGELSAASGEDDLAAAHFSRISRLVHGPDDDPDLLPWRAAAALSAVRCGHRAEGTVLAREHLALARSAGTAYSIAIGLRALATVDPHADRSALLREAHDVLDGVRAARLAAQIETDLAGLLLLGADPASADEALALLRHAEQYASAEDLWPLQGRIRRLLARIGQSARPMQGEALAVLTAAEQKVARLAAGGLTNRQVAGELAVSVKAVEWHLSHVYRKLGIASRAGLAATLGLA
ncbi:LuxR C-terminal-related transcriptional regulator [Nocardioides sp. CN2-186]|uniref:LuxR C-terminal-related transcriptional regulator n=1 Tax=Nocardioides tweenelious TaxID=3156607 RepID=UPI0032B4AE03